MSGKPAAGAVMAKRLGISAAAVATIGDMLGKKDIWWPKPIDLAKFWLEKSRAGAAR